MPKLNIKLVFGIILILIIGLVFAANSHQVPTSGSEKIDEHGTCRYASTSGSYDVFAPTATSAEWSDFRSNAPSSVSFDDCCGDGVTDSDETCDGDSRSCSSCCSELQCNYNLNCVMQQVCNSGNEDCYSDCSGYGSCDATDPTCSDQCSYDSDCECTYAGDCSNEYPYCTYTMSCQNYQCCTEYSSPPYDCPPSCYY